MNTINDFADDIFSITRRKPAPKLRQYRATWPCGSTWEFDRYDLEVPEFSNGEQTGASYCYRSLREARVDLLAQGCNVEVVA